MSKHADPVTVVIPIHNAADRLDRIVGWRMALEKSGCEAHECIVVENAPLGIESAKAAGIYTIGVNTGILDDQVLFNYGADELFSDTLALASRLLNVAR